MTLQHSRRGVMVVGLVAMMAGAAAAQQHLEGQIGPGALYALDVPDAWNGDLVVYAHGIVDPVLPVALPSTQDNVTAVRDALRSRGFADASLAACLLASPAFAQTEGPIVSALVKRGETIDVIDDQGQETRGKVRSLSSSILTLDLNGTSTEIPFERITQIARKGDGLGNGALIGLGAGVAFGLLASTVGTDDCDGYTIPCGAGFVVGSALAFGGIGVGIGVGVDALIRRDRVIYRRGAARQTRVAPVLGRGVAGAVVSVNW